MEESTISSKSSSISPIMEALRPKLKQATLLWLEGVREACCLHRVVIYCLRSRKLMIRTGQCFLLNGFIFLGSILILKSVIIPMLQWILPDPCPQISSQEPCPLIGLSKFYSFLHLGLVQVVYVFWFYPLYIFSFVLSSLWYNEIAKYGYFSIEKNEPSTTELSIQKELSTTQNITHVDKPTDLRRIVIGISEQVYSVLLLSFFFIEVYLTGFVPYIGKALNFLLLAWMYAYYCFEYKWNLCELSLDKRLDFFESNWAFFAGFGSPCVLAIFFFSPLVSYGVMAVLFPLFILTAAGSDADKEIASKRRQWRSAGLGRLPIFCAADYLSMRVFFLFPMERQRLMQDKAL